MAQIIHLLGTLRDSQLPSLLHLITRVSQGKEYRALYLIKSKAKENRNEEWKIKPKGISKYFLESYENTVFLGGTQTNQKTFYKASQQVSERELGSSALRYLLNIIKLSSLLHLEWYQPCTLLGGIEKILTKLAPKGTTYLAELIEKGCKHGNCGGCN